LLSLQVFGIERQPNGVHMSSVQGFPSLQAMLRQPKIGLHVSVVQESLSSQFGGGPGMQFPLEQTSPAVQALPSLQGTVLLTCVQSPVAGLQLSVVQALLSSQFLAVPAHVLFEQTSFTVQALLSLQLTVFAS
jgi:hypothetical protein